MNFIVVEGKSDKEFLEQYIQCKNPDFVYKIIENDGNQLKDSVLSQIQKALDSANKVYIVFDSDSNYVQTLQGIKERLNTKILQEIQNNIEIFLFPNNKDDGELETLLSYIIPAESQEMIKCFDKYVECIKFKFPKIENINKKSKMYAYREVSGLEKKVKQMKNKSSLNNQDLFKAYFDFDSSYLQPLYEFLFSNSKD